MKMVDHIQNIVFQKAIKDYNVKIDGKNLFDRPIKTKKQHTKILEKLLLVKEMIT